MNISQFLQNSLNVFLFRYAPIWFSRRYLHLLGRLYYIANRKEAKLIEMNIRAVFNDPGEAREIVKRTFDGIFIHYAEKLIIAYRNLTRLKTEFGEVLEYVGLEHLESARRNGGVILVTGHFGAIEFMPMALNLKRYPISMVVKFQTERLKQSCLERAAKNDIEVIDGNSRDLIRKQVKALKEGKILLTECDEVDAWSTNGQKTMSAFGGDILVDRTIAFIARHTGAEVLGAFLLRTKRGYRFVIEPIGRAGEDDGFLAEKIMRVFERIVMESPDQWYQWKKFHKMRPEVA